MVRPIDIARKLQISTSALRHYEEWGIVPDIPRGANGYRIYNEEHVAYFECIRALSPGFGMQTTVAILKKMLSGEQDEALWLVSEAQARLHQDKIAAEKTIQVLELKELDQIEQRGKRKWLSISEVSAETSVPASAIRHWEKMGLIDIARDHDNGYRLFNSFHVRQILIIRTLRTAVYSLDVVKQVIRELDQNRVDHARHIAREALTYLNQINREQMNGIYYLQRLLELKKAGGEARPPYEQT